MGQDPNPASFELVSIALTEAVIGKSVGYPNIKISIQHREKMQYDYSFPLSISSEVS